jgi:hypothetical protein
MNDPFDVYIEDLLGMDLEEMHEHGIDRLVDTLASDPQLFAERCGVPLEKVLANSERLRNSSEAERRRIKEIFKSMDLTAFDPEYKALRAAQPALRDSVAHYFRNAGIFCATKTFSNLLMWAHYADSHRGAVLGFVADLERDSMLAKIQPVRYRDERPRFIDEENGWIMQPTLESAGEANLRVLLTKSSEWSYEKELRLIIRGDVPAGEPATFNPYYSNELVEVYLGYRMRDENRIEIIRLAKVLNSEVQIFAAKLATRKYALEFEKVT